ncbi:uncharacterized protein LOC132599192 [Lycium barbarum]|uniref:uncharacterized protein LOC132599192 n=1 Tax=Lycium barbarum TaxID=112863 RepID=UPI00293EAC5B|nr:uncharacterized protein LOC132599192 [Lycium barbarum]XP_060168454.1 uncharacterized protein LOC132599192 [Lycium barbarum]XP_060168461.1 uncharacterized protein LOC132599192 [Lycium barbarum]
MAMKVLEENITRLMGCNIEFNRVTGYEVREGLFQHTVDLARRNCSCRAWQLKGIPCAHTIAAIYQKKYDPLDYIHNCYNKETYLKTYANVLQPVTNMEMWLVSTNPTVAPPEIKSMPSRPPKVRTKEAYKNKKSGKLPRTGMTMTCSNSHNRGCNKRGCTKNKGVDSSKAETPSSSRARARTTEPLGRPKKAQAEVEPTPKWGRRGPRKIAPTVENRAPTTTPTPATPPAPPEFPASSSGCPTAKRGRKG